MVKLYGNLFLEVCLVRDIFNGFFFERKIQKMF